MVPGVKNQGVEIRRMYASAMGFVSFFFLALCACFIEKWQVFWFCWGCGRIRGVMDGWECCGVVGCLLGGVCVVSRCGLWCL
jgi:hypothetical protein